MCGARPKLRARLLALLVCGIACEPEVSEQAPARLPPGEAPAVAAAAQPQGSAATAIVGAPTAEVIADEEITQRAEVPPEEEEEAPPLEVFASPRTTVVYREPRWESELRGRIDAGNSFAALRPAEGTGCDEGWMEVSGGGFACMRYATPSEEAPVILPRLLEGELLPFIYAKPRADRKGELLAPVPRYRSSRDLLAGKAPVDQLGPHRQYAFTEVMRRGSVGDIYVDRDGRAVPGLDLVLQKPSELFGRTMAESPVPPGLAAAWSVSLPAVLWDSAGGKKPKVVGEILYHAAFEVDPTPIPGRDGWLRVPGGGRDGEDGFVELSQIRVWDPGPPLPGVGAREVWLDVDIVQQTVGLRRGPDEVLFVTLVSTGTGKHPTPRGIFRIRNKLTLGKMENRPDEPESYYVEEVPWVQYFYKRFAFHTAYWHRSLGRRRSHGCINLAPRDAVFLFGQTSPPMPPGWSSVFEHEGSIGTTVRVRRGDDPLPDRRRPLGSTATDEGEDAGEEPPEPGAADDEGEAV
jgi:hypothetical protein